MGCDAFGPLLPLGASEFWFLCCFWGRSSVSEGSKGVLLEARREADGHGLVLCAQHCGAGTTPPSGPVGVLGRLLTADLGIKCIPNPVSAIHFWVADASPTSLSESGCVAWLCEGVGPSGAQSPPDPAEAGSTGTGPLESPSVLLERCACLCIRRSAGGRLQSVQSFDWRTVY